jgi:hypothetical protein
MTISARSGLLLFLSIVLHTTAVDAQPQRPASNLPENPVAVALPAIEPLTGSGPVYNSSPSLWPGHDIAAYNYQVNEFLISGTAAGKPYTTRLVIRQPANDSDFSGLAIAEAMHPAGFAHAFELNSVYVMDEGHITVEIVTSGFEQIRDYNPARYGSLNLSLDQTNEILAQAGALIKSPQSPIANMGLRKVVLWGSSASSRILTDYLPAHKVYKQADMSNIYDGFMPTSNGTNIEAVDVPMIQMPTQHEYQNVATAHQDSDEPGSQFRSYEFAALGHLAARHNVRLDDNQCENPISTLTLEPFFSVGLHYLLQWVDQGIAPPRAERVLLDRNVDNDGSLMVLDEFGNAVGGIRNPYVEVPVAAYHAGNVPSPNGNPAFAILCRLSIWDENFPASRLRALYGSKQEYLQRFEASLNAVEVSGWSLPVYHDLIMEDARAVEF